MKPQTEPRIDFVVRNLRAARARQWPEIAEKTGVPVKTISKIAYGDTKDPRTSTTEALHGYFTELCSEREHSGHESIVGQLQISQNPRT